MTSSASATVVVELTPPGRAAVAVVLVAGSESLRAVSNCFVPRSGRALDEIPMGRIVLGHWGTPEGEELVVCRRDAEQIEVHCHGGVAAVEAVVDRLLKEGCQRLAWQEWIERSAPDRIQAAAQIALADATTERTAGILLDQLNGALSTTIRQLIAEISTHEWSQSAETIDELLSRRELGRHLTIPWRVVVFGAPNVGKSSLINALAGYERAIVSAMPGTTRDVVTLTTAMDGWPVQLSDTAGFRETQDELESAGIDLATKSLSQADLGIHVHDATKLPHAAEPKFAAHVPAIDVINKIDLIAAAERSKVRQQFADLLPATARVHAISAINGDGVPELISTIAHSLAPDSLPPGTAVPFTAQQVDALIATKAAIERRDTAAAIDLLHAMLTNVE